MKIRRKIVHLKARVPFLWRYSRTVVRIVL
jgi:hypothetical protein